MPAGPIGPGKYQVMSQLLKKNGPLEIYTDQAISRNSILPSEIIKRFSIYLSICYQICCCLHSH
jgi:hypothetical protein